MNLNNAVEAVVPAGEDAQRLRDLAEAEGRACLQAAGIDYASSDEVSARREGVFASGDIPGVGESAGRHGKVCYAALGISNLTF